jgi:hypothetical protein
MRVMTPMGPVEPEEDPWIDRHSQPVELEIV